MGESNARPRAAEGGAAIQPELPGPVVWEMRTASRMFAESNSAVLAWMADWSDHQCCNRWGPGWGVIWPSRDHVESGST